MSEGTIGGLIQRAVYDAFLAYQLDWKSVRRYVFIEEGEGASRRAHV